jgi:hypothetical protein
VVETIRGTIAPKKGGREHHQQQQKLSSKQWMDFTPLLSRNGGNGFNKFNSNNQPSLKDLVMSQTKINESMNNKLLANDKTLETMYDLCFCCQKSIEF